MKCKHIKNQLSAYIDDALTVERKADVDNHLATCPDCRQALASLQQTVETLRTVPRTPAPDDFLRQVNAGIDARQHRGRSLRQTLRRVWPLQIRLPLPMVAATAMAVLVLMIVRSPEIEKVTDTTLKKHRQIDALHTSGTRPDPGKASLPEPAESKKELIQDTEPATATKSIPAPAPPETASRVTAGSEADVAKHLADEPRNRMARSVTTPRAAPRHTLYEQVKPREDRNTPVTITLTLNQQPSLPSAAPATSPMLSMGVENTPTDGAGAPKKALSHQQQEANNFVAEPEMMSLPRSTATLDTPTEEEGIVADKEKDEMILAESAPEEEAAPPAPALEDVKRRLRDLIETTGGKVIIISEATKGSPATMTASIPAEAFNDFAQQLRQLGRVDIPATIPALERDEARVRVTIRLMTP